MYALSSTIDERKTGMWRMFSDIQNPYDFYLIMLELYKAKFIIAFSCTLGTCETFQQLCGRIVARKFYQTSGKRNEKKCLQI